MTSFSNLITDYTAVSELTKWFSPLPHSLLSLCISHGKGASVTDRPSAGCSSLDRVLQGCPDE